MLRTLGFAFALLLGLATAPARAETLPDQVVQGIADDLGKAIEGHQAELKNDHEKLIRLIDGILLPHFDIDPVTFGILVAINLQTAFLSPPMAMACFYLKGVAPRHVLLSQIFGGSLPFVFIVIICMALIYIFPAIATWLPDLLYNR